MESKEPFINKLPIEAQRVIVNMCYQMGVNGVLKFKKMWVALKDENYIEASAQGLDSKWAKQTPNRAHRLMGQLKEMSVT